MTKEPYWGASHCGHEPGGTLPGEFVGSTISPDGEQKWDVYVFQHFEHGQEVCIRYGNQPGQFIAFPTITPEKWCSPFTGVTTELYATAKELVRAYLARKKEEK